MTVTQVFRKYNKQMMAFLVVFLMVSWLAQDACYRLTGGGQSRNTLQGTAWGKKIYAQDLTLAQSDLQLLGPIGIMEALLRSPIGPAIGGRDGVLNYYLLQEEVARSGVRPSKQEVEAFKQQLGLNEVTIARLRDKLNLPTWQIEGVVDRLWGVNSLAVLVNNVPRVSQAQIDYMIRVTQDQVYGDHVSLPASAYVNGAEPTKEELLKQFEQYKNVLPNQQRSVEKRDQMGFGFGYRQPDRVQVEALVFDLEPVLKAVQAIPPHQDKLVRFFERTKDRYVEKPAANGSQPAAAPTPRQLSFNEVKDRVLADYQMEDARLRLTRMASQAREQAFAPWYPLMQADGTYSELAREKWVDYNAIAAALGKEYKVAPKVVKTDLVSVVELEAKYPVLAEVVLPPQGQLTGVRLVDYAFWINPLVKNVTNSPISVLAVGQDGKAPLVDSTKQTSRIVVFRVVQVEPSTPPASMDSVLERVRQDVILAKAFAQAVAAAEKLAVAARKVGLAQALVDNPEIFKVIMPVALESQPASAPAVTAGAAPTLAQAKSQLVPDEKIVQMNMGYGEAMLMPAGLPGMPPAAGQEVVKAIFRAVDQATSQPVGPEAKPSESQVPLAVTVVPLPGLGLVRVQEVNRIDYAPSDKAQMLDMILRQVASQRAVDMALRLWFNPGEIQSRAQFVSDPKGWFAPRAKGEAAE